ncbi:MAG: hypothetical protein ACKVP0_27710 [Pirellulaceae bacterium]
MAVLFALAGGDLAFATLGFDAVLDIDFFAIVLAAICLRPRL